MMKTVSAALLIALAVPAAAPAIAGEAPARRTFTRDGETYVYQSSDKGDRTVLTGRAYPSGRNFNLTVRGNRVKGYSGGVPVSFTVESAPVAGGATVASR